MGENVLVKIEGGGGKGCYLYIVKIENFHLVLTSSLNISTMPLSICSVLGDDTLKRVTKVHTNVNRIRWVV